MYTRLDVINAMIRSTGARPLTAENSRNPLYMKADPLLKQVEASVLSFGLWFNTETRVVTQQADGTMIVPQGCIKADPTEGKYNLSLRGNKMYDLNTGTFNIGCDLRLNMHFLLDFEDMPLSAMDYIRKKAVYDFYLDEDGADPKLTNYRNERDAGWSTLYREHLRNRQVNIKDNPHNTYNQVRRGGKTRGVANYGT